MEDHPLYGKRKKKREVIANPLFVAWLTEWKEEAAEKGWKSQYTYGKALTALKKFPLSLSSGKDCKILENFGDKICKMLDDRLAQHVSNGGTTPPVEITNKMTHLPMNEGVKHVSSTLTSGGGVHKKQNSMATKATGQRHNSQDNMAVGTPNKQRNRRAHDISDSSNDEEEKPARKRQKSGRKSGEREYVPAFRSGPYAILLTLYRDMQSPNARGFMTKAELIRAAQPLADKSFCIADPGCRYTSWSSMGTLIKKGLVIKESSPAKYSLTDAGCELAHRLEAVKGDGRDDDVPFRIQDHAPPAWADPPRLPQLLSASDDSPPRAHDIEENTRVSPQLPELDFERNIGGGLRTDTAPRFQYWYVTEEGEEVIEKDKAAVTIDDEISVGFLVKCNYTELLKAGVRYKLDTSRPLGDDYVYAYLHNDDTADMATPHITTVPLRKNAKKQQNTDRDTNQQTSKKIARISESVKGKKPTKASKMSEPQLLPLMQALENPALDSVVHQPNTMPLEIDSEDSSLDSLPSLGLKSKVLQKLDNRSSFTDISEVVTTKQQSQDLGSSQSSVCSWSNRKPVVPNNPGIVARQSDNVSSNIRVPKTIHRNYSQDTNSQESSQNSIQSLSSVSSVASVESLPKPDFALRPGEFDIVLCVDNAEYYGVSRGSSKTLLPDLLKNGVDCELRKLHVGDLLWIAREKVKPVPGQLEKPQGRELVLDYIIERKRMDDLVSSCIDGRFKEQKFRLKKCGLQFPIYLIEDYGSMQHFSIPEKTIKQAITNTQVIDGFQVKRTKDSKETVAFLTVMTRYLQSCFRDKSLYASSLEDLKEFSQTFNINDSEQRLATFEEFNQGSVKTKALTVQEMFGKQLIQLHGMSAEKARAVIDLYPTPSHLFAAYERCSTEVSKESLLSSIKCGKSARNLGAAQSKQIYQLYCTKSSLT